MIILLFAYFFVVLWGGWQRTNKSGTDYLSIENTTAVKGIFIYMVFYSHFNSYIHLENNVWNNLYYTFFMHVGQAMVAMFLFYSGYGVMESIKKKGQDYVLSLPTKRFLKTLINFDIAVFIYLIIGIILGRDFSFNQIILSFTGWESLGNSNWYIFVILLLYVLTYMVFVIFPKKSNIISVIILTVVVTTLIIITKLYDIKDVWWYDTALCYILGMWYSLFKRNIEKVVNYNLLTWGIFFIITLAVYIISRELGMASTIVNLAFTVFFVILTMRITFNNKLLKWGGEHLFEIYILQRIPMILFKEIGLQNYNIYLYFIVCLFVTIILSILFKLLTNLIWQKSTDKQLVLRA